MILKKFINRDYYLSGIKMLTVMVRKIFRNSHFRILLILNLMTVSLLYFGIDKIIFVHDGVYHIHRMMGAVGALRDGQIFMQFDPFQANGFGNGSNLFYGPMMGWFMVLVYFFVRNVQIALMILMFVIATLTSLIVYKVAKKIIKSDKVALISTIIYMFEPIHIGELLGRGNFSGYAVFMFAPLIVLGLYELFFEKKNSFRQIFLISFGAFGVLMNHNLSALIVAIGCATFCAYNWKIILKNKKIILSLALSGLLAIGMSAIFLLPFIESQKTGLYNVFSNEEFKSWHQQIGSTMTGSDIFGITNMFKGNASVIFGISPIVIALLVLYFSKRKEGKNTFIDAVVFVFIVSSVIGLEHFSKIPGLSKFFGMMQFTQRLMLIPAIFLPFAVGFVAKGVINEGNYKAFLFFVICVYGFIIHLTTEPGRSGFTSTKIDYSIGYNSIAMGEYIPKTAGYSADGAKTVEGIKKYVDQRADLVKVIDGGSQVKSYSRKGSHITVLIEGDEESVIEFPMFYYPGFKANFNGKKINVVASKNGLASVKVGGSGNLELYYGASSLTVLGFFISVVSFAGCGAYYWFARKRENVKK